MFVGFGYIVVGGCRRVRGCLGFGVEEDLDLEAVVVVGREWRFFRGEFGFIIGEVGVGFTGKRGGLRVGICIFCWRFYR